MIDLFELAKATAKSHAEGQRRSHVGMGASPSENEAMLILLGETLKKDGWGDTAISAILEAVRRYNERRNTNGEST